EVPISSTWKFTVASTIDSEERHSGDGLRYRSLQVQNGTEREVRGKVERADGELRAEIMSPEGPAQVLLPTPTLMPIASMNHTIDKLRAGSTSFLTLAFDAQGTGEAFRVGVTKIDDTAIRRRPPADKPMVVPGRFWPVVMSFTRGLDERQKP